MINICITTYNRFDLCNTMINSILEGSILPDRIYVLSTSGSHIFEHENPLVTSINPAERYGLAKAFNWFIANIGELRIICNDDLVFRKTTLNDIIEQQEPDKICSPIAGSNLFSIFTLPDSVINTVGLFDETISPNYYYFEDNDYMRRSVLAGVSAKNINTDIQHVHSGTLKSYSKLETQLHHQKFQTAQSNYRRKWGGLPEHETFSTPYNRSN